MSDDDGYCLDTSARDWINDPLNRKITDEHRYVEIFDAGVSFYIHFQAMLILVKLGVQFTVEQKRDDEIVALCATPLKPGTKWALRL